MVVIHRFDCIYFPVLEGEGGSAGVVLELICLLVNDRIWALPLKLFQKMIQFSTATIPFTDLMLAWSETGRMLLALTVFNRGRREKKVEKYGQAYV